MVNYFLCSECFAMECILVPTINYFFCFERLLWSSPFILCVQSKRTLARRRLVFHNLKFGSNSPFSFMLVIPCYPPSPLQLYLLGNVRMYI